MSFVETASLEAASEVERKRRKEKLFKAIIEGDIQLVCKTLLCSMCHT